MEKKEEKKPDKPGKKNIHAGHRQRMRERFAHSGFDGYQPHEMLEQLLFEGYARANTNPIAHRLIDRFGSLEGVLEASYDELIQVEGVGERNARLILSVRETVEKEILKQYCGNPLTLTGASFLWDWFLRRQPVSAVGWIGCDPDGRMTGFETLNGLLPEREALLAFGEERSGQHGFLLTNAGSGWNGEMFAFLDGVLGACGGRLHGACVLRGRKIVSVWKDGILDETLNITDLDSERTLP